MASVHRRSVTRRRGGSVAVAVAVAVTAAVAGACSGNGGGDAEGGLGEPGGTVDLLDEVADATMSSSSSDATLQVHHQIHDQVGEHGGARTIEGHVDADDVGTLSVLFEPDRDPLALELRSDGEHAWVSGDDDRAVTAAMPAGATWVAAPLDDLRALGAYPAMSDLLAAVPLVRGLEPETEVQPTGGIDRIIVGEIHWDAVLAAATPDEAAALDTAIPLGDAQPTSTQATLTIGRDGKVRFLTMSVEAESPRGTMTVDVNFAATSYDREVPTPPEPPGAVPLDDAPELRALLDSEV